MKNHRHMNIRRFGRIATKALLIALLLGIGASAVAQSTPNIGYCTNCSTAGFAWAAEQAAPLHPGVHPVYVIDTNSGQVRYFNVEVWWDCGGNNPQSAGTGDPLDCAGVAPGIQSNCIHKQAITGTGDAQVVSAMQDARFAVMEFYSPANMVVDGGALPDVGDSAIDLIGPANGPAGYNRLNLQNRLADHYSGLWGQILFGLADASQRMAGRFIGSGAFLSPASVITVNFPDGGSIQVQVTQVSTGPTGSITVQLQVLPETARLPNGNPIPNAAGHFHGFGYQGDPNTVMALIQLSDRFGGPSAGIICVFSCNASSDNCTLSCQSQ